MSTAWRYSALILTGAVLLLAAGLFTLRSAAAVKSGQRGLVETRKILGQMGGKAGIDARKARLGKLLARLHQERKARGADAAAFSRRIEEAFAELGLELTSSTAWMPVPKLEIPGAAAFERTFAGAGSFDRLLDAVATLESWPDGARVRSLSVTPKEPGKVAFTLEVTAVRSAAPQEDR